MKSSPISGLYISNFKVFSFMGWLFGYILFGCCSMACKSATLTSVPNDLNSIRSPNIEAVSIPKGAGSWTKQPVLILGVESIDACADATFKFDPNALQLVRIEIESLIARMKRFNIYSIYNVAGVEKAMELGDVGIVKEVDQTQIPKPDLFLNVKVTLNAETQDTANPEKGTAKAVVYKISLFYNITDSNKKILDDTPDASGTLPPTTTSRELVRTYDPMTKKWSFLGGFDPSDKESQAAVIRSLMANINKGLVGKIAIALPITREVTGLSPTKSAFAIKAGQKNGVFKGTTVIVWLRDGDFPYAIATAKAEPIDVSAKLNIIAWNDSDPDANIWIEKIKKDGFTNELKGKLFATTEGIPLEEMLAPSTSKQE